MPIGQQNSYFFRRNVRSMRFAFRVIGRHTVIWRHTATRYYSGQHALLRTGFGSPGRFLRRPRRRGHNRQRRTAFLPTSNRRKLTGGPVRTTHCRSKSTDTESGFILYWSWRCLSYILFESIPILHASIQRSVYYCSLVILELPFSLLFSFVIFFCFFNVGGEASFIVFLQLQTFNHVVLSAWNLKVNLQSPSHNRRLTLPKLK